MITAYTKDNGQPVRGATPGEVVAQLHKGSRAPAATDQAWMEETAARTLAMTGVEVDVSDPAAFLRDMELAGMIKVVEGQAGLE